MHELKTEKIEGVHEYQRDFALPSITRPVLVDNIFYEFGKATLTAESSTSLNELKELLEQNPNITIELSAHCDFRGSASYNEKLSQARAESAVAYLVAQGIEKERMTPVGYGEAKPKVVSKKLTEKYTFLAEGDVLTEEFINNLKNEEQQEICNQINRRTEFQVLRTTYKLYE